MNEDALRKREFWNKATGKGHRSYRWFTHLKFLMEWWHTKVVEPAIGEKQLLSNLILSGNFSEVISCHPGEPVSLTDRMWGKYEAHVSWWLLNLEVIFFSCDVLFHFSISFFWQNTLCEKVLGTGKEDFDYCFFLVTKIKEWSFVIH